MKDELRSLFFLVRPLSFLLGSALASGCAQVRLVRDIPDGGVVSVPNDSNEWPTYYRNRAERLMQRKCPEGYVIVGERSAVDNPATHDGRKSNEDFDYEGGYIRLTTYNRKVHHIIFRSAAAVKNAPPPPRPSSRSPATDENKDELPPPRPLPPSVNPQS